MEICIFTGPLNVWLNRRAVGPAPPIGLEPKLINWAAFKYLCHVAWKKQCPPTRKKVSPLKILLKKGYKKLENLKIVLSLGGYLKILKHSFWITDLLKKKRYKVSMFGNSSCMILNEKNFRYTEDFVFSFCLKNAC